ncbi:hypothetical protein AB1Y20_004558 [Prymnesium parvum]|uniref:Uncharacterized protein n=1 Tax=Prymnesium parvum TaxID=97485 RepID=A0AB34IX37_PRYPA
MLTPIARFIIDPKSDDSDIQFTTEEILEKINIEENCTAEDRAKIAKMLASRRRLFATKLGWAHAMQMSIETPGHDDGTRHESRLACLRQSEMVII